MNLRSHTVKSNDGSITIVGTRLSVWESIQELLKNEFNTLIFLVNAKDGIDISNGSKSIDLDENNSVDISDNASFVKFRHGHFSPVNIHFTPIEDFKIPRYDQFVLLHNGITKASAGNKNVLISCTYGGGRTGAMLACSKIIEKFKTLDDSEKSELLCIPKTDKLSIFGGIFSHLKDDVKTTPIVAEAINELR